MVDRQHVFSVQTYLYLRRLKRRQAKGKEVYSVFEKREIQSTFIKFVFASCFFFVDVVFIKRQQLGVETFGYTRIYCGWNNIVKMAEAKKIIIESSIHLCLLL